MNVFPRSLLADMRCPYCASALTVESDLKSTDVGLVSAILRCDCYQYPLVRGIAVLRQLSPVSSNANGAVDALRSGDAEAAHQWLRVHAGAPGVSGTSASTSRARESSKGLGRWFRRQTELTPIEPKDQNFEDALQAQRPSGYAEYLHQRFANPSFLAALAPLSVLSADCTRGKRRRMLDVLCGIGHSSGFVRALCPEVELIMADVDYVNLHLGSRFLAPGSVALCIDGELPLPFNDASLDALFCLDGLHYIRSKAAFLSEVDRTVAASGAWAFAHMHNASRSNKNAGAPLTEAGYMKRAAFGEIRVLPERQIIEQYRREGVLDLGGQPANTELESSPTLTLFGARDARLWRRHEALDTFIATRTKLLAVNPLYRPQPAADGIVLKAQWPFAWLKEECEADGALLPDTVHLSRSTLQALAEAGDAVQLSAELRELVRSYVLVPLHRCYSRNRHDKQSASVNA